MWVCRWHTHVDGLLDGERRLIICPHFMCFIDVSAGEIVTDSEGFYSCRQSDTVRHQTLCPHSQAS